MINYIFASFFIIGILYSFYTNTNISNEMLIASSKSIEIIFTMIPIMCLWLGIMNIAKKSGLLDKLSKLITPFLKIIFPEIPKNSPCFSYISINIIMNMLGVGNAATPFGLKAMKELDKDNKDKNRASEGMITFLILKGEMTMFLNVGDVYKEPGYMVLDSVSQIGNDIVQVTGNVNTSKPGTYKITYTLNKDNNNKLVEERTVIVMAWRLTVTSDTVPKQFFSTM